MDVVSYLGKVCFVAVTHCGSCVWELVDRLRLVLDGHLLPDLDLAGGDIETAVFPHRVLEICESLVVSRW